LQVLLHAKENENALKEYAVDLRLCGYLWLNARGMGNDFSKETAQQRTYRAFEALVMGNDAAIDVLQAALLIASTAYPDLDMEQCKAHLDDLAQRIRERLSLPDCCAQSQSSFDLDPATILGAINQVLFEEEHFHSNRDDYYNPDNSFFNRVLETHSGIPITLSLLYIEVGKRVGIALEGIALPYQFVVRYCSPEGNIIYIDPYENGLLLNMEECKQRILRMSRGRLKIREHWFKPVSNHLFLVRMLNNLKHIYLDTEDYEQLLIISDFILLLIPHYAYEWRDRGVIHLQLKRYSHARRDLLRYLELEPNADDYHEIRTYLRTIDQMIARLN
jgi:regulator of sirC expression with transglutaminase-like and TPR domain